MVLYKICERKIQKHNIILKSPRTYAIELIVDRWPRQTGQIRFGFRIGNATSYENCR